MANQTIENQLACKRALLTREVEFLSIEVFNYTKYFQRNATLPSLEDFRRRLDCTKNDYSILEQQEAYLQRLSPINKSLTSNDLENGFRSLSVLNDIMKKLDPESHKRCREALCTFETDFNRLAHKESAHILYELCGLEEDLQKLEKCAFKEAIRKVAGCKRLTT